MKRLPFLLALALPVAFSPAQIVPSSPVTANPNTGEVLKPVNLWEANAGAISSALGLAPIATTGEWTDLQSVPSQFPGGATGTAFGIYNHASGDSSVFDYSSARSAGAKWFVDDAVEFRTAIGLASAALTTGANTFADDQSATAWLLTGDGSTPTITAGQNGLGWADGRVTLQTSSGVLQLYQTGSPVQNVLYFAGRIAGSVVEASTLQGQLSAANLTGQIPGGVSSASYLAPFDRLQTGQSFAGANGIPYVTDVDFDGTSSEPTVGVYWVQANVVAGGTGALNDIRGRYRTKAQTLADLSAAEIVAVPASSTATGTAGQIAYDSSYLYICTAANTWRRVAIASW